MEQLLLGHPAHPMELRFVLDASLAFILVALLAQPTHAPAQVAQLLAVLPVALMVARYVLHAVLDTL
jgi:hypothetical protein